MSGLVDVAVAVAVVALIVVRQVRPQPLSGGRRWWLVPAVLICLALREPGILDARHQVASGILLAVELLVGVVMGAAWAWTSRVWTEPDGSVWTRGTKATVAAWIGGIVVRVGLAGLGALMGIHQGTGALLLALAVSLLVRSATLTWRAQQAPRTPEGVTAYRGGVRSASWKDPV
ncbi:DUF1453 domain-containing protein [Streptomyces sulfonofaciens]|uniref:DUF1453 domain-containing protein n=1 Tax=Streptomyces sulfonofaciens TaxID=68272 RepID=A0A919L7U4_9ACTN|nr:CcdC protein domain-containing protein [Streptomyces sulfonofaciens]GHH88135.1 DUF1453 domain-containing protein [Streptomyces sulfonofaciens]